MRCAYSSVSLPASAGFAAANTWKPTFSRVVHALACALLRADTLTQAQSIVAVPSHSLAQARMSFLMGQPDEYLSVNDVAAIAESTEDIQRH
jgi:hypothetical protein